MNDRMRVDLEITNANTVRKKLLLWSLLGVMLVGWGWGNSKPKFVDEYYFDKTVSDAASALGNLAERPCNPQDVKTNEARFGGPCKCYYRNTQDPGLSKSAAYNACKGKIIFFSSMWGNPNGDMRVYPKVSEIVKESVAPKYIQEIQSNPGSFNAIWLFDGKFVKLQATCPPASAGTQAVERRFRDCWAIGMAMTYLEESKLQDAFKKQDLKY